jgi:ABC-type nitrate/sulfonate/bicarbonate transport system substrate-binding protein
MIEIGTMRGPVPRRNFLLGMAGTATMLGTSGLLSGCGDDDSSSPGERNGSTNSRATQGLTTQLVWIKNVEFAGWWIALQDGYYDDEGIDA